MNNTLYHSGVLSILPNIKQVADGEILYKLRYEEIEGIKSRIGYLSRSNSDTKYQLFINNPLEEILNRLSIADSERYGNYANVIEHQKDSLRKQLGIYHYNQMDVHDSTTILKNDPRYVNLVHLINTEYLNFKNTSHQEPYTEGANIERTWFAYKRNTVDAIRIFTYENAKTILNFNDPNTNVYMLHGDFDAKIDNNINHFSDTLPENKDIFNKSEIKDIKRIFGNIKDSYEDNYIAFLNRYSMNLIIPNDSFIIKGELHDIIPNNFNFAENFIDDEVGDSIWGLMQQNNFETSLQADNDANIIYTFIDKYSNSKFPTTYNVYKYLMKPIQELSPAPEEERLVDTWGLNQDYPKEREYLGILLGKVPENLHVPLDESGILINESTQILNTPTYEMYNLNPMNVDSTNKNINNSK